ncbi:hypothetical protein CcaverHIS002_0600210 [Cutaneotrichosporon cavernicola]|uniref:NmrA-like domain-containing protein n=1 Tax=Cutaneotrichosporon cavernicola TaxID=279322 RepID=A0AA48QWP5_9TREE|nr:uncharacterized protein CcaverHIS019_0500300 [Cutaneotrichosporon cavernicola]BEI85734.1 hypothetical protein CcaverHIS002_0600210 [Cutaneotrichosporon cavernicola]BEI92402.1 hypothetical protein CcaverHIS019_0500300 [Cutaneotrichosporon cavernicola]BEJ00175.1 hypothetical protein CcaverHIS631_0500320 [Cutaneotrichosporon cavernicola]BEJ07946.1 hypothetical protein CcaverHIS641_0500310 [Cutaneotrichosporon cavernicola]
MAPTVALLGATGDLGGNILAALVKRAQTGELNIVVLHRQGSNIAKLNLPSSVSTRALDADNASVDEVRKALVGVDVLISAAKQTPDGGKRFVETLATLAKEPGSIKVYIPSYFTANWAKDERENPANVYLHGKCMLLDRTIAAGVPTTYIANGLFEWAFLDRGFFGVDPKANELQLYGDALNAKFSYLSLPFLGESLAQLLLDPTFGPGQNYTFSEAEFTGHELVEAFNKVHGTEPKITQFTDADVQKLRDMSPAAGLGASWRMHWGNGNWKAVNLYEPKGVTKRSLEQAVRESAQK